MARGLLDVLLLLLLLHHQQRAQEAGSAASAGHLAAQHTIRPEFRQGYPLNLSISISGGKETNRDSLSNGERKGMSPACKSPVSGEL